MKEKGLHSTAEAFKEDLKKKGILLNSSSKIQQNGIHLKVLKVWLPLLLYMSSTCN